MRTLPPIISRPSALSLPSRLSWQLIGALMWAVWLGCWAPLITLLIWEFGLYRLNHVLVMTELVRHFWQTLVPLGQIVFALGTLLLGWAWKEYLCFGNLRRRSPGAPVEAAELAEFAQLDSLDLTLWQSARNLVAEHDEQGRVRRAREWMVPDGGPETKLNVASQRVDRWKPSGIQRCPSNQQPQQALLTAAQAEPRFG